MEYRQNADWRESYHPRDKDGKFTEKGSQAEHSTSLRTAENAFSVKLGKREYAIVRNARAQKFAEYKHNGLPKQDYVFTDKSFVIFDNYGGNNLKYYRF